MKQHEKNADFRPWVCENTFFHKVSNGAAFIFFGTELKNYYNSAEAWIQFLLGYFSNAEGIICFQYEEDEGENTIWIIAEGTIIDEQHMVLPFVGYGNVAKTGNYPIFHPDDELYNCLN